jgi:glycosyltransferase involved in cell wall biosynthesis
VAGFPDLRAKCVTVPNSADHVPEELAARPAARKVLFVGRLSPEKGVHDLITAFRGVLDRVPDASLHLVGAPGSAPIEYLVGLSNDPHVQALRTFYEAADRQTEKDFYLAALEDLAGPELGGRIVFEGYADHHTIQAHYGNAAVLVNPSLSESFGITVVEAMMMKLPVVATRVGGMKHTVAPDETGFLVEPGNPAALGQAIETTLTDAGLAARMGTAGRARALKEFSWDSAAERLTEAYAGAQRAAGR